MLDVRLLASMATMGVTALVAADVGLHLARRARLQRHALPARMFAVWWLCGAALALIVAAQTLLAAADLEGDATLALQYALPLPLAVGLCGLVYYLVYARTGRTELLVPVAMGYVAFYVFATWFFVSSGPWVPIEGPWGVRMAPLQAPTRLEGALFGAVLAGPVLAAALAALPNALRTPDPVERYRLSLVATALFAVFVPLVVGYAMGWDSRTWFPALYEGPVLLAGFLLLAAFRPPAAVEKWLRRTRADDGAEA